MTDRRHSSGYQPPTDRRGSGSYQPLASRKIVGAILLVVAVVLMVIGVLTIGVEFYHSVESRHPAIWTNLGAAGLCIALSIRFMQTGSVRETISFYRDAVVLNATRREGGDRFTDLPAQSTNEHEGEPEEESHR